MLCTGLSKVFVGDGYWILAEFGRRALLVEEALGSMTD